MGLGPSQAAGGPRDGAAMQASWPLCAPLVWKQKDPSPSFLEFEIMKAGGLREGMDVSKSRKKEHKLNCQQENMLPHEAISSA